MAQRQSGLFHNLPIVCILTPMLSREGSGMSNLLHGGGGIRHDAGDHREGENSVGHGGEPAGQEAIRYLRKV